MKKLILVLVCILASLNSVFAGIETYSERREGAALVTSSTVPLFTVYDDQYATMATTSWTSSMVNVSVNNFLRIGINPDMAQVDDLEGSMTFTIKTWKWVSGSFSVATETNRILTLKYDHDNPTTVLMDELSTYDFTGAHKIEVYLTAITNTSGFHLEEVFVQSEIQVERYYLMDTNPVTGMDIDPDPSLPYYEFQWNPKTGAEWYELEWVHIPNTKLDGTEETDLTKLAYDYYRNSTRIVVKGSAYRIPAIFDPGYLVFRVRPIGYTGLGNRKEGAWSVTAESGTVSTHPAGSTLELIIEYEDHINWAHQVAYGDDGERFESVGFSDGLGRPRQTVGHNTATEQAVVSNVYYDQLGRPVISDLPTPTDDNSLKHYPAFNLADGTSTEFQASVFDAPGSNACNPTGQGFSPASGAGEYYSPSNPDQDGANVRIPDAEKYPYNRVVFENDFSGRVKKVSGYGDDLKTGSGKETFFFYPSANQDELNRLFGAEVGYASHYSKMVTVDANGQIYVQYADMAGRVIATYLAGENPESLDAIEGNGGSNATVSLLPQNEQFINMAVPSATLTYHEYIYGDGEYTFNYAMTPQQFRNACLIDSVCLDCVYDLDFRILDNCDNVVYTHTETLLGSDLDKICATKTGESFVSEPIELGKGSYTFVKTLRINQDKLQENWCYYIENNTCLDPISEEFNTLYEAESFDDCVTEALPIESEGCEGYREAMLRDMMPGGQYATYTYSSGSYSYTDPVSIFTTGNELGILWSGVTYEDENGNPILVANAAGVMVSPASLSNAQEFIEKFDPSWALSLLAYHPEECFLRQCVENEEDDSHLYDSRMMSEYTYLGACASGLLNPLAGYTLVTGCTTTYTDPFFATGSNGEDFADDMEAALDNYGGTGFDAWRMAIYYAYCNGTGDITSCLTNFGNDPDADCYLDLAWVTYRNMYLELKRQYVFEAMHAECDNSQIGVDPDWTDKIPIWGNILTFTDLDTDGAGPDTGATPDETYFEDQLEENCQLSCEAFADDWIEQLSGCDFTGVNLTNLRNDMIALCMSGCDSEHPMGSTTAPPGYSGTHLSLYEVIIDHFDENNLCSDLLISNPGPYRTADELEDILNKPLDTCACNEILQAEWTADNNNPDNLTIEQILAMNTGVTLEDANYLVCACQKIHAGPFDPEDPDWVAPTFPGITIPSTLSCSSGNGCVNCTEVGNLVAALHTRFNIPDFETVLNYSTILTNYLNNELHFHLSYYDYIGFINQCNADTENPYCTVSPEAKEWVEVMKLLTFRGQLLNGSGDKVALLDDNIVYKHGELQNQLDGHQYWSVQDGDELTLHFGTAENNCAITLTLPEAAGFDFGDITGFEQIYPLTENCSGNNTFSVEVKYLDCGQLSTALLTGTSDCFAINNCVCDNEGLLLCDELPELEKICYQPRLDELYHDAEQLFLENIKAMYEPFVEEFNQACAEAFSTEELSYTGPRNTYQYTLFYYDQAGNLVKTVAPLGIDGAFDPASADLARDEVVDYTSTNTPGSYSPNALPVHSYETTYKYNSYDQLVTTANPDQQGSTRYLYDRYGRLVLSQNPVQADDKKYSYVLYDAQGRPIESGQIDRDVPGGGGGSGYIISDITETQLKTNDFGTTIKNWIYSGIRTEVTYTVYDKTLSGTISAKFAAGSQQNLRLRVATVMYFDAVALGAAMPTSGYASATHYSYDIHGNVIETLQDVPVLAPVQQDIKSTQYEFELISGNVKKVDYQKGELDQISHTYTYDAMNRLEEVHFSTDNDVHRSREAHYYYFDYGPLARVEIGQHKVQANDYTYTINGWMKGMNSNTLDPIRDAGRDGSTGYYSGNTRAHRLIARDITGYTLGYFPGDYTSIGSTSFEATVGTGNDMANAIRPLYNGNIAHSVTAIKDLGDIQAGVYSYDQLHRLKRMRVFRNQTALLASNTWTGSSETPEYYSDYTYDRNGNLQLLNRNGIASIGLDMDEFDYEYTAGTNRLRHVADNGSNYGGYADVKTGQSGDNYSYDKLGQLLSDTQEGLALAWRKGDKKLYYQRDGSSWMEYVYNPLGQRVLKIKKAVSGGGAVPNATTPWEYTLYSYDANGQVMSTYTIVMPASDPKTVYLDEQMIYGAGRLGLVEVESSVPMFHSTLGAPVVPEVKKNQLGRKRYELTNWLGNVNAVITDKKLAVESESYMTVTGQAGVSVVGNTITRTAAGSSWGAAGGSSVQTVEQGQYIEWTMGGGSATNNRYIMAGISYSNPNHSNTTQQYCWYTYLTGFTIVESGLVASGTTLGGFGALNTTAVLKIARENGQINYYKDNVLQRSVTDPQPETAMIVDFSLFENARSIYSLKIGTINYDAVAVMKADYYPFGMIMPGRNENASTYRYAYNGMEQDQELKGQGNSYTTEFRQYDPRLGRWLSLDPLMMMFPDVSPYCAFNNNPIYYVDPYGLAPGPDDPPGQTGTEVGGQSSPDGEWTYHCDDEYAGLDGWVNNETGNYKYQGQNLLRSAVGTLNDLTKLGNEIDRVEAEMEQRSEAFEAYMQELDNDLPVNSSPYGPLQFEEYGKTIYYQTTSAPALEAGIPIAITSSGSDGPLPFGEVVGAAVLTAAAIYTATAGEETITVPLEVTGTRVLERNPQDFYYVTYTKVNAATGQVYVGRTSGYGDPQTIVNARDVNHHMTEKGYGPAILSTSLPATIPGGYASRGLDPSYHAIRGSEQLQIEHWRSLGISGNSINGISPTNKNLNLYIEAAKRLLGH